MYTLFGAEGCGSTAIEIVLKYCGADYRLVAASSVDAKPNSLAILTGSRRGFRALPTRS